jgi:LCP family protein required for cell wall assembly
MMKQEDFVNAVNQIHASAALKAKAISGEPASHRRNPAYTPLFKGVACLAAVTVIALGVLVVPRVLKPVVSVAPAAQSSSVSFASQAGTVNGLYHDAAIQNILVLGIDQQDDKDTGRSDSMLMISVDKRHNKLKVTSFLRDMYVKIPDCKDDRLNAAYAIGKAPLTVKTIESNFGVAVDNYVTVNYSAFDKIVDRLGGVTLTVTGDEARLVNRYSGESAGKKITEGNVLLTGKQALYYSRIRYLDSDFGRTERQRKMVSAIVEKLKSSNISTITGILDDVLPSITTNMTKDALVGLIKDSPTLLRYPVLKSRLPADGAYQEKVITEMSVLVPDIETNKQILTKFIYENDSNAK